MNSTNNITTQSQTKEKYIYDIFVSKIKVRFIEDHSLFCKSDIMSLFQLFAYDNEYISREIISDKYFGQYLNNILSKLYLNREIYRIQRGIYSFSSNLVDFKIKLEKELSSKLIKNIILENKLSSSEAINLENKILVPKALVKNNLSKKETEIFFKKFKQYKEINIPKNMCDDIYIKFISLANFYPKNDSDYLSEAVSILSKDFIEEKEKKWILIQTILDKTKTCKELNNNSIKYFKEALMRNNQINAK